MFLTSIAHFLTQSYFLLKIEHLHFASSLWSFPHIFCFKSTSLISEQLSDQLAPNYLLTFQALWVFSYRSFGLYRVRNHSFFLKLYIIWLFLHTTCTVPSTFSKVLNCIFLQEFGTDGLESSIYLKRLLAFLPTCYTGRAIERIWLSSILTIPPAYHERPLLRINLYFGAFIVFFLFHALLTSSYESKS